MGNCLRGVEERELIAKDVQLFNQINSDEARRNYLKLQGKIYCLHDRAHDVIMLHIDFMGWT